ncbi:D-alanyl-D-alanine carboxypeptidase family protein [Lichenifustis flavocetrariae]|uniref:Serine hydrolase n=1 Tax=Lichenifustis flavocetrariae TaxID=2949735 RepID=A0AA41YXF7_9HYPH|nr:serine hydrolase [Lichenifustis flavocetrariae]MCW6508947.1 serine hydrolase [Lichenifustis flavocetrariae]
MRVLNVGRRAALTAVALCVAAVTHAQANPALVVDVDSGRVLYETQGTAPWFPASLTKLMTTYVALSAVREGRITMDTPLMVSPRAASQAPSKMGFRPGTLVTLDNALKMLMVKSPNDIAVTIAEGIGGSVEDFAELMNTSAARLGLHESHFVNPNGLPDPNHYSSARDMALIARALLREFPEERGLFNIGVLAFGNQMINNHNGMLGRYPGVDGMKTGYTCSAGYNVVLSAERDGRRLITVVLGAPSTLTRTQRAAMLFDRYFADTSSDQGQLSSLASGPPTAPPDLRPTICGRGRASAIAEAEAEDAATVAGSGDASGAVERVGTSPVTAGPSVMSLPRMAFTPVRVFVGPVDGWTGPIAKAKDMALPPVSVASATARSQAASLAPMPPLSGPTESPAPAPLALVGAVAPPPAAAAANAFVRKTKSLSLAVATPKHRPHPLKRAAKLPPTKTISILAKTPGPAKAAAPAAKPHKAAAKPHKAVAKHPVGGKTAAK